MFEGKLDPRDLTITELRDFFISRGLTKYRAPQLFTFLHKYRKRNFAELTTFSKDLRNKCNEWFLLKPMEIIDTAESIDTTRKFLFKLFDDNYVESVLLSNNDRWTACISSQVGCKYGCIFCRTSQMNFIRNLQSFEIVEQFGALNDYLIKYKGVKINNLVFMGMGEPLDNYNNIIKSVNILSQSGGYELSKNRMTLSTCGHIQGIKKLIMEKDSPQLAISLNSPEQEQREFLMPWAKTWRLNELIRTAIEFSKAKRNRVTLEYIMIKDFNDSISYANKLLNLVRDKSRFKINLIPFNKGGSSLDFEPSSYETIEAFQNHLKQNKLSAHLRHTKGEDILAACGQLAYKPHNKIE